MCLICVEFQKKRMTRDEMLRALPEMIEFSKTKEDKEHFEKLKLLDGEALDLEVEKGVKRK